MLENLAGWHITQSQILSSIHGEWCGDWLPQALEWADPSALWWRFWVGEKVENKKIMHGIFSRRFGVGFGSERRWKIRENNARHFFRVVIGF
ncbi:hypothetical protein [Persicirhabdus sediminis]|uniref:Uncharacterized protein n=1 Tax=Persicirhabdus sediminis TaxID=454144 RepID=A0A8J7MFU8_9BACT|nr:hypothetical protein [Persicirhabdus sediminis]MBK1792252.1 hypothetical protein [Persicirhabdus sediminis]